MGPDARLVSHAPAGILRRVSLAPGTRAARQDNRREPVRPGADGRGRLALQGRPAILLFPHRRLRAHCRPVCALRPHQARTTQLDGRGRRLHGSQDLRTLHAPRCRLCLLHQQPSGAHLPRERPPHAGIGLPARIAGRRPAPERPEIPVRRMAATGPISFRTRRICRRAHLSGFTPRPRPARRHPRPRGSGAHLPPPARARAGHRPAGRLHGQTPIARLVVAARRSLRTAGHGRLRRVMLPSVDGRLARPSQGLRRPVPPGLRRRTLPPGRRPCPRADGRAGLAAPATQEISDGQDADAQRLPSQAEGCRGSRIPPSAAREPPHPRPLGRMPRHRPAGRGLSAQPQTTVESRKPSAIGTAQAGTAAPGLLQAAHPAAGLRQPVQGARAPDRKRLDSRVPQHLEITALIFGIEKASVSQRKQRLRQKMGLDCPLDDFLQAL